MVGVSLAQSSFEPVLIIILFGLFGFIANWIVYTKGFFLLPILPHDYRRWSLGQCCICLSIYLLNGIVTAPILFSLTLQWAKSMQWSLFDDQRAKLILLQTLDILANITLLALYLSFQKKGSVRSLWKDPQIKEANSYFYDILVGFFTWFISFPVIVAINSLCELINRLVFQWEEVDQVAVKFLKLSASSATTVIISIAMIILAAPVIEEFLFRGCIQNWIRKYLGPIASIVVTSLIFSMMHYAPSQAKSNFPLIVSLFVFSLYLGFLYEKTKSLLAPIVLHMTFNTISVIRILLT
jgi:uncharacterized protein